MPFNGRVAGCRLHGGYYRRVYYYAPGAVCDMGRWPSPGREREPVSLAHCLAGITTPHALILSPRFWGSGWHPGNLVRHAMRRAGWRGSSTFLRRRRELACRIASPPSACHPKSCPPAPLGRASCLRAPDPWRPVRLRAGMAQMRPVGGRYLHRLGAGHSRRGRYLRERGKPSREKLPESSHFSVWFLGGEKTSLSRNSSNGKSLRGDSLAFCHFR